MIQTLVTDVDQVSFSLLMSGFEFLSNAILAPFLIFTLVFISWQIAIGAALILGTSSFSNLLKHASKSSSKMVT
ncbi:MAG UNVERIFIED_CONTAM: hypothetical protein LVT10_15755 [Anaerolineae bacterium]